jgi:hypothetical protein
LGQSEFSYTPQKTVYQQPQQNRTVFQNSANTQHGQKRRRSKTPFFIVGGLFVILLIVAGVIFFSGDSGVDKNVVQTTQLKKLTENEIKIFINEWLNHQNNKNVSQYLTLYSTDFNGIKRTKSGKTTYLNYYEWSEDRRKMYEGAVDLNISIGEINIIENNDQSATAKIEFIQYYSSAKYSDEGKKVMNLRRANDNSIKIVFEELVYAIGTGE